MSAAVTTEKTAKEAAVKRMQEEMIKQMPPKKE
jgi:hypothetical protein